MFNKNKEEETVMDFGVKATVDPQAIVFIGICAVIVASMIILITKLAK